MYIMDKIENLKKLLQQVDNENENMVEVFVPYDLKDELKQLYDVKWNAELKKNFVKKEYEEHFEKIYLTDLDVNTYEKRKVCREQGATYDKERGCYFFIEYQLNEKPHF